MKAGLYFAAALGLSWSSAQAGPPFNPKAALAWCVETVVSPVPIAKRIYVLGPDKTKEAYGLNGGIAYHDLETRCAVEYADGMTLVDMFRLLPKYMGDLSISVWRQSAEAKAESADKPLYAASISQASSSKLVLQPDDLVEIWRPVSGLQL
jgi:hypothetical protein